MPHLSFEIVATDEATRGCTVSQQVLMKNPGSWVSLRFGAFLVRSGGRELVLFFAADGGELGQEPWLLWHR